MNRGLAVLSNMLTFALDKGMIEIHPWCDIDVYPEERMAICVMTVAEERALVEATLRKDLAVGVYCGLLGETAMRPEEGLRQQWSFVNLSQRLLTVDKSKTKRARHIPLSDLRHGTVADGSADWRRKSEAGEGRPSRRGIKLCNRVAGLPRGVQGMDELFPLKPRATDCIEDSIGKTSIHRGGCRRLSHT